MKIVTIRQLTKRLQSEDLSSSYLLLGEDTFLQDISIDLIKKTFLIKGGVTVHISVGDDPETLLMDELNSMSLFEDRRVIQVRNISKLSKKAKPEFTEYLSKPASDICLILINENYYDRTKFIDNLKNRSVVLDVRSPIKERNFKDWILDICHAQSINIDKSAVELIIERQGNSLAQVYSEIKNLWLMIEEKGLINKKLVKETVGYDREYPLWQYLHTLGIKNLPSSIEMVDSLIDYGISIPQITSYLCTLFENIYWAKNNKSFNIGYPRLNYFLQKNLNTYCRMFDLSEISDIFVGIRNADIISKTKTISPHNILIPLTINICQGSHV